jgi:hypothetical protein
MQGQSMERRVTDGTAAALGALSLSSWIIGASAAALPRGRFVSPPTLYLLPGWTSYYDLRDLCYGSMPASVNLLRLRCRSF